MNLNQLGNDMRLDCSDEQLASRIENYEGWITDLRERLTRMEKDLATLEAEKLRRAARKEAGGMCLPDATPVEIDTKPGELDLEYRQLVRLQAASLENLYRNIEGKPHNIVRGRKLWRNSEEELLVLAEVKAARDDVLSWEKPNKTLARYRELGEQAKANRDLANRLEAEYRRRPWNRYISVVGGHIHSGEWCKGGTIKPSTLLTWNPTLSGKDVAEAVSELGPLLCTHCFPDAPVAWTTGKELLKPDACSGSAEPPVKDSVTRFHSGVYGLCSGGCGQRRKLTQYGVMAKHKDPKKS